MKRFRGSLPTLTEDNVNKVTDIGYKEAEGEDDVFENMNIDEYQGDEGDLSSVSSVFMTDSSNMSESEYDISAGTLARVSVMKVLMLSSF